MGSKVQKFCPPSGTVQRSKTCCAKRSDAVPADIFVACGKLSQGMGESSLLAHYFENFDEPQVMKFSWSTKRDERTVATYQALRDKSLQQRYLIREPDG